MARTISVGDGKYDVGFEERKRFLERENRREERERKKIEKEEKKSPYKEFYQINKENSVALQNCLDKNPKALKILLFIFDNMDKYNAVMCSYQVFQEALNLSKPTITRSIKYLKDKGLIYVMKSGTSNVYIANPNLVWCSWGSNKKYCKFPTNVILAESEQENVKIKYTTSKELEIKKKKNVP